MSKSNTDHHCLDEIITVSEAAKLMNVTIQHVRRLCKNKTLTARYADGVWLIHKNSMIKDKSSE